MVLVKSFTLSIGSDADGRMNVILLNEDYDSILKPRLDMDKTEFFASWNW
jgi:hypothetical protein